MALTRRSSTAVPLHPIPTPTTRAPEPDVVWLRGEYDGSSVHDLARTLRRAADLDESELIVDLSGVDFLGSSCVGVLLRAREQLRRQSRTLTLRSPSRSAKRVLDICDPPSRLALVPTDV